MFVSCETTTEPTPDSSDQAHFLMIVYDYSVRSRTILQVYDMT